MSTIELLEDLPFYTCKWCASAVATATVYGENNLEARKNWAKHLASHFESQVKCSP